MTRRPIDCDTPCAHHGPRGCTVIGGDDKAARAAEDWLTATGKLADTDSRTLPADWPACPVMPRNRMGRA